MIGPDNMFSTHRNQLCLLLRYYISRGFSITRNAFINQHLKHPKPPFHKHLGWTVFDSFFLSFFREREREKETDCWSTYLCIHWVILIYAQIRDRTCNLGVSGWHSNQSSYPARTFYVSLRLELKVKFCALVLLCSDLFRCGWWFLERLRQNMLSYGIKQK